MKIKRSKAQNKSRIDRMKRTNELVESLQSVAGKEMHSKLQNDEAAHRELLKNLLI